MLSENKVVLAGKRTDTSKMILFVIVLFIFTFSQNIVRRLNLPGISNMTFKNPFVNLGRFVNLQNVALLVEYFCNL